MNSSIRVFPQALRLGNEMHALQKDQHPCCIWMTGLSGAGKSTLANALEAALYEEGLHTFLLDGDNVRGGLCSDLDMSHAGRSENIRRLAEVARLMADAGLVVIVSAISPFRAERAAARARFAPEQFLSVYVSTPFAVCAQRDPKGLYRAAQEGRIRDFTGLDSPYEAPTDADCTIDTSEMDLESAVACLRAQVLERCRPR